MSLHLMVLALTPLLLIVVGLAAYFAFTWPHSPSLAVRGPRPFSPPPARPSLVPPYDGKEPFELKIKGMPGLKMYLDPQDQVMTPTILVIGNWETTETTWFLRLVKPGGHVRRRRGQRRLLHHHWVPTGRGHGEGVRLRAGAREFRRPCSRRMSA